MDSLQLTKEVSIGQHSSAPFGKIMKLLDDDLLCRLTDLWGELLCMFMNSITLETESQQIVNQNLMAVLDTPILRYPSCDRREVRDCVLRSEARNLLHILKQRLPFDSNRCVIAK